MFTKLVPLRTLPEAVSGLLKKVLLKITEILQETPVLESLFNKVADR